MKIKLATKTHSNTRELGEHKEKLALRFLKKKGFKTVTRNYHCRYGEVDLIVENEEVLVFVEVRYRKQRDFGGAATSITSQKQQKLIATAESYLQKHPEKLVKMCRIDVIAIDGEEIQWIPSAIER